MLIEALICLTVLDIPKRPPWDYKMSKEKVESQESKMFELYLKEIYEHYKPEDLSYFEHNLEVSIIQYMHTPLQLLFCRHGDNCGEY